jgi:serine/threonine protein kinase
MEKKVSDVIGEGTYGCVHKPSLKCKDSPDISYDNKVSKLLLSTEAKKELKEYDNVRNADKNNEYYLGVPENCDVDIRSVFNLKSIQKCRIGSDAIKNLTKYKLLIMGDGGINLEDYTKKMKEWSVSEMSEELCEKFLLESLRLFHGLKIFEEHGLVHHDLKPQNIVYNEKTNRLNFIDFGLMQSIDKIKRKAKASNYDFALFHWSYPWELEFIDKKEFDNVAGNPETQEKIIKELKDEITNEKGKYYEHSSNFFYYALNRYTQQHEYQQECSNYVLGYERTIKENMKELKYPKFLEHCVRTIDVFGLGISLNYWFYQAKRFLSVSISNDLKALYSKMIEPELKYRPLIDEALKDMEEILTKNGLLDKYNKKIRNSILIDNEAISPIKEIPKTIFKKIAKQNPNIVMATPGECPDGKVRNEKGRCVKIKAAPVDKIDLPCPEGKERNPKTRRCVAKCKPNYVRDENFKCIKNKTLKNRSVTI